VLMRAIILRVPRRKPPSGRVPKPRFVRAPKPRAVVKVPKEHGVGTVPNPRRPALVRDVGGGSLRDLFALFRDLPRPPRPGRRRSIPRTRRLR